jgi:cyclopropane-fatty-acyl-phospholipid synthase
MFRHTKKGDRDAIQYHYDVSNDFYSLWLDRNMVYSCAYFRRESDTLELAQEQKLDHILNKLMVRPGERFLDIGCGWGALILRAARKYGAKATGVTLSRNQFEFTSRRIREEGLEGRCEVRLQDYRDIPDEGTYDKIASVGMFEHVGLKHLGGYFSKVRSLLAENGLVMNHGITASDPDNSWVGLGAGEFINRYVFPHGELPHLSLVLREMALAGFEIADVESLRRHYARTCLEWAKGLEANRERAIASAGEKRFRIWQIYLAGCAHGFANEWMNIYQVLARKEGGSVNPLPLTREYMYGPSQGQ